MRAIIVIVAGCLVVGGDLSYRGGSNRTASPAAATLARGGPDASNTLLRLIQVRVRHDDVRHGRRSSSYRHEER